MNQSEHLTYLFTYLIDFDEEADPGADLWGEDPTQTSEEVKYLACGLANTSCFSTQTLAHIPLKNEFALGARRKLNRHKQHEMYMPNASPNTRRPNATYIPLTGVGVGVG